MTTPSELQKAIERLKTDVEQSRFSTFSYLTLTKDIQIILTELASMQQRLKVADERLRKVETLFQFDEGEWWPFDDVIKGPTLLSAIDSLPSSRGGE